MRLKLFKKYFLTTSLIIVFSLAFIMMILSFLMNNYIISTKQETMKKACNEVVSQFDVINDDETVDMQQLCLVINSVARISDFDVFIANANGKIVICGCDEWAQKKDCEHSIKSISKDLFKSEKENKEFFLSDIGIYSKQHYVFRSDVHKEDGSLYATVFATAPVSIVKEWISAITKLYAFSAIVPIIVMFFFIYIMTYRMTKPLKLMSEASKAMAKGDFSKRIPVISDDEIGELSMSFNMMTNSLARLESMRKTFVADVSHELKTPMTTISGFIDGILDGTIEEEKQKYYLTIVSDEVKRLSRLVQSMLSMSRLESGEFVLNPELFDLGQLLCSVVISQEQRIESNDIQIVGLDEIEPISVTADRDLIHQVVYNLVDNAIKFTDKNGSISFTLKNENKKTVLTVTNTGKGIPEKELPYIFERFYKVDKSRSASKNSTGLGLYIVKTIITAHGGQVAVSSKEDQFTAFKIILPNGN